MQRGDTDTAAGGTATDPSEEGGEPDHRSTALLSPPQTLCGGPGILRPVLHYQRGTMLEETRSECHL